MVSPQYCSNRVAISINKLLFSAVVKMYVTELLYLCFLVWFSFIHSTVSQQTRYAPRHDRFVGCYLQSWAVYREGEGKFSLTNIDPQLCTHLMYAYAGINESDHTIVSRSPYTDLEENYGLGGFKKMTGLKTKYPHLKVLLTIGGWSEGSIKFSKMASQADTRKIFVDSVVNLLRVHNFDGLDINWEYPGLRGGSAEDKNNFPRLLKDLREEFDKHGLLLTLLMGGKKYQIDAGVDLTAVIEHLDWINLVTYQYNGQWKNETDSNAPLRSNEDNDVEFSVNFLLNAGVPKEKILMGIASYGHCFIMLSESENPSFGSAISQETFQGEFTKQDGDLGFNEICREMKKPNNTWIRYWDDLSETPFLVDGLRFVSYDDRESVNKKINFMMEKGLKGAFLFSLDTDDFRGSCSLTGFFGENNYAFPILKRIHVAIQDYSSAWKTTVYSHEYGQ